MTLLTLSQKSFETVVQTKKQSSIKDGGIYSSETSALYENMLEPCTEYYMKGGSKPIARYFHNLKGGIIL